MTYGAGAKQSQLSAGMFYKDTAHKKDHLKGNAGMKKRQSRAAQSHEIDMIGRLHCDIMNMNRYLLNWVDENYAWLNRKMLSILLWSRLTRWPIKPSSRACQSLFTSVR